MVDEIDETAALEFPRPSLELGSVRARQLESALLPYDRLDAETWPEARILARRADQILDSGWAIGEHSGIGIEPPVAWDGYPRSVTFHLHAWNPLSVLLAASSVLDQAVYLSAAREAAIDWLQRYQRPVDGLRSNAELDETIGGREDFVWYDMGVGQRVYRLAYLLDASLRDRDTSEEQLALMLDGLYFHHAALARPGFFRDHNNHGIYQALGQIAAARRFEHLPAMDRYRALGEERIADLYREHFLPSGVHAEHSPGYQYMMLETFAGARTSGLLVGEQWDERLQRMEAGLAWMIQPDGLQAMLGDTDPRRLFAQPTTHYTDPGLIHLASDGEAGEPPPIGVRAYDDAGYVFMRLLPDGQTEPPGASYLGQQAGFHSHTHKHADHLAFVWYDRGRQLITDPGRYGYSGSTEPGSELRAAGFLYSDPNRIYAESTGAHSTVRVDGRDFPRRRVRPFGSAVVYAGEQDGIGISECEARTYPDVRHRRVLLLRPGEFLLCVDWLLADSDQDRTFEQRFPLDPAWSVDCVGAHVACTTPDGGELRIDSLLDGFTFDYARGQLEPRRAGWFSDRPGSMVPAPVVGVLASGAPRCCFATLLSLGGGPVEPLGQRLSPTLTKAEFSWRAGPDRHQLSFTRGQGAPFSLAYREPAPSRRDQRISS